MSPDSPLRLNIDEEVGNGENKLIKNAHVNTTLHYHSAKNSTKKSGQDQNDDNPYFGQWGTTISQNDPGDLI